MVDEMKGKRIQILGPKICKQGGRTVRPAVVLIRFFLIPFSVRVSLVGARGTSSLGVCSPSSMSISPIFSKVSPEES